MATTRLIPYHASKAESILSAIKESLDYGKNPKKTRNGELISFYACDPRTADLEFLLAKQQYEFVTGRKQPKEKDVLMYQIRQSFKPGEISPEEANRLSYELAMRFTKGNHAFIVTTHEDKEHIHSHIYFNSTRLDCKKKFRNFWGSSFAIRRLSDHICIENGLSIIENPKPSKGSYNTWLGNKKLSNREQLRRDIDCIFEKNPSDFDEFLREIKSAGYIVKQGKNLTFNKPSFDRAIRCNSLKGNYTEEAIQKRLEDNKNILSKEPTENKMFFYNETVKVNLLIDVENSIKAKNSPGYEQWAKIFNLKQAAQTLIFLQENKLDEYEKLEEKIKQTTEKFNELSDEIKATESEISKINTIQRHIGNYRKTRDVYTEYRKAGYSKKSLSEHEGDIILHKAAKKAFDDLGIKKLPSIKELQTEYTVLKSKKSRLYNEYRQSKTDLKNLSAAKANTDRLLQYSEKEKVQQTIRFPK